MTPVKLGKKGGSVTLEIDPLLDGGIVLIGREAVVSSLTPDATSLLR